MGHVKAPVLQTARAIWFALRFAVFALAVMEAMPLDEFLFLLERGLQLGNLRVFGAQGLVCVGEANLR